MLPLRHAGGHGPRQPEAPACAMLPLRHADSISIHPQHPSREAVRAMRTPSIQGHAAHLRAAIRPGRAHVRGSRQLERIEVTNRLA